MDLQLDVNLTVKGCKNVYGSFDKYAEAETLDGQNQYRAEGFGLQDGRKGILGPSVRGPRCERPSVLGPSVQGPTRTS